MRARLSAPAVPATAAGRALPAWAAPLLLFVAAALVYAVHPAQFARIYGVQTFCFLLACLLAFAALAPPGLLRPAREAPGRLRVAPPRELWPRLLLLALALPPLLLAAHLQPTTLLGAAGLGLWAAGTVALPWLRDPAVPAGRKRRPVAGLALLALAL